MVGRIRRLLNQEIVELIDIQSGQVEQFSLSTFEHINQIDISHPRADLLSLDENDWKVAIDRFKAIQPLLDIPNRTAKMVKDVAYQMGVNPSTVYRWINRFENTREVTSLLRQSRQDIGKPRVDDEIENLMSMIIQDSFLNKQSISPTRAYRNLLLHCKDQGITPPHVSTFKRRIKSLAPLTVATAREGKSAARKFLPNKGTVPNADYPYAVIQIDHTMVDIILVDELHRLAIQRPYITVAIDVYSRMVVGYYISFDSPGVIGTAMCITNTVLPKRKYLDQLGLSYDWPCCGLPSIIHVDNAKEFRGNTLKMACTQHCIDLVFRPVRKPNYGGHIERLMGTLMQEIHALPGTTKSRSHQLKDYNPEKKSALTLQEFELWFANLVLGSYHYKVHSELGIPPITKFEQGIFGDHLSCGTGHPPLPLDEEMFRIDFLPYEYRTIQSYGIAVDNIYYQGDILSRWIGAQDPDQIRSKRKFLIRRDPRDISFILFYDPELMRYFRLPYQNPNFPSISLWELKAILRYLKQQGKKAENQDMIFKAYKEMQHIEDTALKNTKSVRIAQAKKRHRDKIYIKQDADKNEPLLDINQFDFDIDSIEPFVDVETI